MNSTLKALLLENSNIREVLPELEIDGSVNLDRRRTKCLIRQEIDVEELTTELVTNKKDKLGKAVLEAKDNQDKEILVNSSIL
ncbi:MAG: hypothetical protein LBU56_03345 [Rickettsiales bacterium]|jgi:hypothetical protein|nr:hypothetical protein [Rickettsiales bacterium]